MDTPSGMRVQHKRPVVPLKFPSHDPEWDVSESEAHKILCWVLYWLLRDAVGDHGKVGSDCFVYFDASKPQRKCAPDAFVKLRHPQTIVDTWKTWEDGVPELCIEVLSPSDTQEKLTLPQKLERFHTMGVREVITFNRDAPVGQRFRAWDWVEGDLVERQVEGDMTPCLTLGLYFVSGEAEGISPALRLARDPAGTQLLPTQREQRHAAEQSQRAAEHARGEAQRERDDARAEVERLRAELARLQRE